MKDEAGMYHAFWKHRIVVRVIGPFLAGKISTLYYVYLVCAEGGLLIEVRVARRPGFHRSGHLRHEGFADFNACGGLGNTIVWYACGDGGLEKANVATSIVIELERGLM
jgi:hypothetical protein